MKTFDTIIDLINCAYFYTYILKLTDLHKHHRIMLAAVGMRCSLFSFASAKGLYFFIYIIIKYMHTQSVQSSQEDFNATQRSVFFTIVYARYTHRIRDGDEHIVTIRASQLPTNKIQTLRHDNIHLTQETFRIAFYCWMYTNTRISCFFCYNINGIRQQFFF